jgi:hypothetical protein
VTRKVVGVFVRFHAPFIRKRKLDIRAKQGIAFPGVEIRIMTDEGTLAHRWKKHGRITNKGGMGYQFLLKPKPG